MSAFPLALKLAPSPAHATTAWFIPGDDPQTWIDEIVYWAVVMENLRLFFLPTSARDPEPIGVLVMLPDGVVPQRSLRAQPYGVLAGRLFLPVNSVLNPPVSDLELSDVLLLDLCVLHPSAGLVGFGNDEAARVCDLIARPVRRDTNWDMAAAVQAIAPRLVAIEPAETPGVDEILELGRDDIGLASDNPLPPASGESALKTLAQWAALPPLIAASVLSALPLRLIQILGRAMRGRQSVAPSGRKPRSVGAGVTGRSSWLSAFNDWAKGRLARLARSLLDARARELDRLRRMLDDDPDEGLRHAIPLYGAGVRGLARPGSKLMPRDANFNLSRLFGGGKAADPWAMQPDMVQDLRQRYREAANRELRLGRFRRAAYIFAQLLGEFSSSANALEQGRHFREAAVLYRDHIKSPIKAAQCLENGGLLLEAVLIYEQLQQHEKAGDLYTQLELADDAALCYRRQVAILLARPDPLAAARLLETKLMAPDEALATLTDAWPATDPTGQCLQESFQLLGRLARHEDALSRLQGLRTSPPPDERATALVGALAAVATGYPDSAVRRLGADATRVVAGRQLASPSRGNAEAISRAVCRLVPEDKLLARDAVRFLAKPVSKPVIQHTLRQSSDPVVLRQFRLNDEVVWKSVANLNHGFCAVGVAAGGLYFLRSTWDGRTQGDLYPIATPPVDETVCDLRSIPSQSIVLVLAPWHPLHTTILPPTDAMPARLEFACPAWLSIHRPLGVANAFNGLTWLLIRDGLRAFRSDSGALMASHALPESPPEGPTTMVTSGHHVYITWGAGLLHHDPGQRMRVEALPRPASKLVSAGPHVRSRVAVGMSEGAVLLWTYGSSHPFAEGMFDPHLTFTRGGMIAAADVNEGRLYRTERHAVARHGSFASPGASLLALTPTAHLDEFATFTTNGIVTVYKTPEAPAKWN